MEKDFDTESALNRMFEYIQDMDRRINDRFDKETRRTNNRFDRIEQNLNVFAGDYKTPVDENAA